MLNPLLVKCCREQCNGHTSSRMHSTKGGHRPGCFVVRLAPPQQEGDRTSFVESLDATLAFFAVLLVLWYSTDDAGYVVVSIYSVQTLGTGATLLAIMLWLARCGARSEPSLSALVHISALGVQIATTSDASGRPTAFVGTPRFLPREDVVDAVVSELVMGRCVESKVMFRVLTTSNNTGSEQTSKKHATLMREGSVHLVDAFPLVKLSHVQCLKLYDGIMRDLDKL